MAMSGRSLRMARLLKADQTPLFVVPLDHTVTDGPFASARDYDHLLDALAANGADAVVVHKGRVRLLAHSVYARMSVIVHLSASTRFAEDPADKVQVGEVEDCLRRGADAVSVHVNLGSPTEPMQLRVLAQAADCCDRFGLPLLAMIYVRGAAARSGDAVEAVRHAASVAVDLGADLVKLPLAGSVADMRRVVESCPIPILAAGGAPRSDAEFARFVTTVLASGTRGLAAGRNIFMAHDPAAKTRDVRRLLDANAIRETRPVRIARERHHRTFTGSATASLAAGQTSS